MDKSFVARAVSPRGKRGLTVRATALLAIGVWAVLGAPSAMGQATKSLVQQQELGPPKAAVKTPPQKAAPAASLEAPPKEPAPNQDKPAVQKEEPAKQAAPVSTAAKRPALPKKSGKKVAAFWIIVPGK